MKILKMIVRALVAGMFTAAEAFISVADLASERATRRRV
jgi:hypothetical protein